MARPAANQGLMPSILDRLTDSEGVSWQSGYSPRQMLEAVRRDLEELFNTHRTAIRVPAGYPEVARSVVTYGLPDLPSLYRVSDERGQDVRQAVEDVIRRFEPRLRDVRVVLSGGDEDATGAVRRLRFHIEAGLNVDPSPEVEFETVLEIATGQTSISSGGA